MGSNSTDDLVISMVHNLKTTFSPEWEHWSTREHAHNVFSKYRPLFAITLGTATPLITRQFSQLFSLYLLASDYLLFVFFSANKTSGHAMSLLILHRDPNCKDYWYAEIAVTRIGPFQHYKRLSAYKSLKRCVFMGIISNALSSNFYYLSL